MDEGGIAFYVTVAAAAAGMFGLGAGLLSARSVSLAERASTLARERVDLAFVTGEKFGDSWRDRHRLTELAAIHRLTLGIKRLVTWSLAFTGLVVLISLLVVAGVVPDSVYVRWTLIVSLVVAGAVWVIALRGLVGRVERFTSKYAHERERRRASEGTGIFGAHFDSEDLDEAMGRLLAPLAAGSMLKRFRARVLDWRWRRKSGEDTP